MFVITRLPAAGALLALGLLTACSGNGTSATPLTPGVQTAAASRTGGGYAGLVFVSDVLDNTVWICPTNLGDVRRGILYPTGQLQGVSNPVQLAVDAQGTVYVANAQIDATGAGEITEYARGSTSPTRTLKTGLDTATGVAVDGGGTVYVSNKYARSVVVFAKGQSSPEATITANLTGPDGLATDRSGNLYIADSSGDDVLKLAHGSSTPTSLQLSGIARPTGVAVDAAGHLYVANMLGASSNVTVYARGQTKPERTIVVPGPPFGSQESIGEPLMLSIAAGTTLLASAPISLVLVQSKEWFGYGAVVAGFADGQSQASWRFYAIADPQDAVFQPAR